MHRPRQRIRHWRRCRFAQICADELRDGARCALLRQIRRKHRAPKQYPHAHHCGNRRCAQPLSQKPRRRHEASLNGLDACASWEPLRPGLSSRPEHSLRPRGQKRSPCDACDARAFRPRLRLRLYRQKRPVRRNSTHRQTSLRRKQPISRGASCAWTLRPAFRLKFRSQHLLQAQPRRKRPRNRPCEDGRDAS